jgi:hypothetical protein
MTDITPIRLVVGDDWIFPFAYRDAAGIPIDLTGFGVGADIIHPGARIAAVAPDGDARLLDQNVDETRGKFIISFDRSTTIRCPAKKIGTHLRAFLVTPEGDIRSFPAWPLDVEAR